MLSNSTRAREARARRLAVTFDLRLRKSRRAIDYGCYVLLDIHTGIAVCGLGMNGYDADLDEVEEYLAA